MVANPSPKNIVICCDGTGNQFGDQNSNVIKLFSLLTRNSQKQILYYHPGVGTKGSMEVPTYLGKIAQKLTKWNGFAYGYGIINNIANAYSFLMHHYQDGDQVFLIGFSRGAFTVRALSSFIYEFGLLENGNESLIEYAMSLFINSNVPSLKLATNFKKIFGRKCSIHFVGVWETVSSIGWFYDPLTIPYTAENPVIQIARQALAIDERRSFFRPNLWGHPKGEQDFKQVWFAGVHSDVGGSYPTPETGLGNISLLWLLEEAEQAGLSVDLQKKIKFFQDHPPDCDGPIHHSLKKLWWIPEILPQPYIIREGNEFKKKFGTHFGHHRKIPEGSLVHDSVFQRMQNPQNNYHPLNLPKDVIRVPTKTDLR